MKKKRNEEFAAKHPLAMRIMRIVEKWSADGYPAVDGRSITPITRSLLEYWFNDEIHEDAKFHVCQKRAIEAAIYCYEMLNLPLPKDMFVEFGGEELKKEGLEAELEKMEFPRYAIKMATGTGKTWVINALIVWQYFNSVKYNDSRFSSHFLLVAPGNIVYDRLLDSFQGKIQHGKRNKATADLSRTLFMPSELREDFNLRVYTKEDINGNTQPTESSFILITNWHQLLDTSRKSKTKAEDIGIEFQDESDSYRVQNYYDFLTNSNDLIIINDEAHHLHNASDKDQKRWQESLEILYRLIKKEKEGLFCQFDFTATPYTIKGSTKKEWMKHVIYDYGLVEAMRDMLVKQIFIEKSNYLSDKISQLSENERLSVTAHIDDAGRPIALSEVQKHMLEVGYKKLTSLEEDFKKLKINKKPVMFVVADNTEEANMIAEHLKKRIDDPEGKQVATIHIAKKDELSDDEYKELKETVFASDDYDSNVRIIVSVMMLREGFDVRNVCTMVVLRPSESPLLTEQILGRGIRLMFTEGEYQEQKQQNMDCITNKKQLINAYDLLFVVEHPSYNQIYNDLVKAGATITTGESTKLALDSKRVLVSIDPTRVPTLDLSWPFSFRDTVKEDIDFGYFDVSALPQCPVSFDRLEERTIIVTDFHPQTKFMQDWELKDEVFTYTNFLRTATFESIDEKRGMNQLSRYFDKVAGIIDEYVSEYLFGRSIDFNLQENAKKLRNYQLFDFVVTNVRKAVVNFVAKKRPTDVLEIKWMNASQFPEIKVAMERALHTKKCVYPHLDFGSRGGFEYRFAENWLEKDFRIISYLKLDQYVHRFSIPYVDNKGYLGNYYPDFLVKLEDMMYLIETKSEKDAYGDINVKAKMKAAQQFCSTISKAANHPDSQPKQWRYVVIPENLAKEMEGRSFRTLIERCEAYMTEMVWSSTS